jgi:hypothetical protein
MSRFIIMSALSAGLVAAAFGLAEAQTGGGGGGGGGGGTRSAPAGTTAPTTSTAPSMTTAPRTTTAPATKTTTTAPKHCPPGQRGKHNSKFAC